MRRERGVMHFVYIACLLEMQGRKNMAGQGREENGKYNTDSLNEISDNVSVMSIGLLHFTTFWIAHTFAVHGI